MCDNFHNGLPCSSTNDSPAYRVYRRRTSTTSSAVYHSPPPNNAITASHINRLHQDIFNGIEAITHGQIVSPRASLPRPRAPRPDRRASPGILASTSSIPAALHCSQSFGTHTHAVVRRSSRDNGSGGKRKNGVGREDNQGWNIGKHTSAVLTLGATFEAENFSLGVYKACMCRHVL